MRKRIFRSICLACFITLLLTLTFIISVIYNNSAKELKKEVINHSIFISSHYAKCGAIAIYNRSCQRKRKPHLANICRWYGAIRQLCTSRKTGKSR